MKQAKVKDSTGRVFDVRTKVVDFTIPPSTSGGTLDHHTNTFFMSDPTEPYNPKTKKETP